MNSINSLERMINIMIYEIRLISAYSIKILKIWVQFVLSSIELALKVFTYDVGVNSPLYTVLLKLTF
jgi:hypothetical protein